MRAVRDATPLELFTQGRDSYNVVLGGMLGAYLGLTISRNGVTDGSYFSLGELLLFSCWYVYCMNIAGDQFHRGQIKYTILFLIGGLASGGAAYFTASEVGVDHNILLTIFVIWGFLIFFEIGTGFTAVRGGRRSGNE
jgi:hypothetical protein